MAYKSDLRNLVSISDIEYVVLGVKHKHMTVEEGSNKIKEILIQRQLDDTKRTTLAIQIAELANVMRFYVPKFSEVVFQHMIDYVEDIDHGCIYNGGRLFGHFMNIEACRLSAKATESFMQMIINAGADVNHEDADGYSPMTYLLIKAMNPDYRKKATSKMMRIIVHAGAKLTKNVIRILRRHDILIGEIRADYKNILLETLDDTEILLSVLRDPFEGDYDDDDDDDDSDISDYEDDDDDEYDDEDN